MDSSLAASKDTLRNPSSLDQFVDFALDVRS